MSQCVLMMGTFDSKGNEFAYLYDELLRRKVTVKTMNVGVFEPKGGFPIDTPASQVAARGGTELDELRRQADRGVAMRVMCNGARSIVKELQQQGKINGVISMGGGGGTSIATTAMQALPIGFPKVCVTTLACGDTHEYVGTRDIILFPSIVDISGINQFSRLILSRAAGAVCGMMEMDPLVVKNEKPIVCLSMFGNSTAGVEKCAQLLKERGCEPLIFHATGGGGRSMEELIEEGHCQAVLDITTTEWADELCGGILSAGSTRLDGPGKAKIPHVIVPGCLDMVNFGSASTVPEKYKTGRILYEWNPMVTLMRTNRQENEQLGRILAQKANASPAPVAFAFPLRGLSILDGEGQCFCDWETDRVLFDTIRASVRKGIPIIEVDANINDDLFAQKAVELLFQIWKR